MLPRSSSTSAGSTASPRSARSGAPGSTWSPSTTGRARSAFAPVTRAAGDELGFPLLVKPSDPVGFKRRFRRQAFRCDDPGGLEEAYARAEEFAPMVQELVPGGDGTLYSFGSYLAADGRVLGAFCG